MNVLIVEDEARIASFVERGLTAEGFTVTDTGDGSTGYALACDESVDLVIAELLARVHARPRARNCEPGSNVAEVYVGYLRRKLGKGRIETVRGADYRLVA